MNFLFFLFSFLLAIKRWIRVFLFVSFMLLWEKLVPSKLCLSFVFDYRQGCWFTCDFFTRIILLRVHDSSILRACLKMTCIDFWEIAFGVFVYKLIEVKILIRLKVILILLKFLIMLHWITDIHNLIMLKVLKIFIRVLCFSEEKSLLPVQLYLVMVMIRY